MKPSLYTFLLTVAVLQAAPLNLRQIHRNGDDTAWKAVEADSVFIPDAAADGTTDDRAAIQAALDAAETQAALVGGKTTVLLGRGQIYRVTVTTFVPTSGPTLYGGLAMPENVILNLNGSTIEFHAAVGTTDGCWIFPKGLNTNTTDYGAASNWEVTGPGRLQCSDATFVRLGNSIAFCQCENVTVKNLSIGPRAYHAFEIQSGRNLLVENVVMEAATITSNGAPDVQFDVNGNAAISKNAGYTPPLVIDGVTFRGCFMPDWPAQDNGQLRRIEFGHSDGVERNIKFEDCEFYGIKGPSTGNMVGDVYILDLTGPGNNHRLDGLEVRNCRFHCDAVGGASSAIACLAGAKAFAHNILIDRCWIDGTFVHGIIFGSSDTSTILGAASGNRSNITVRDCTVMMGTPSSSSGGTYGPQAGATQTSGSVASCYELGKNTSVTIQGCKAILPDNFGAGLPAGRGYYGYHIMNNLSTTIRNCSVEFWNTVGETNAPAASAFISARVDCDEVANTAGVDCQFVVDGFTADTRMLGGVSAATTDIFTATAHWLADAEPVVLEFGSGFTGITSGTTYFARDITADTFKLAATAGGAAIDITATGSNATLRKARVYTYAWLEDPMTAGTAAEARLTGYRRGIQWKAPVHTGNTGNEVDIRMILGEGKTLTAAGTTGARTIHKKAGSVNFAAAATSLVVTNNLVTANSIVTGTVATNDATMKTGLIVPAAGSFTIHANAAATAETRVVWRVD